MTEPSADEIERQLEAALARQQAGDLAGAEALVADALARDPDNATALYMAGMFRFSAGDAAGAEPPILRLVALRPNHAQAHFTLASLKHWRDDRVAAIAAYDRTLALQPDHLAALVGLSRALAETGAFDQATETAEKAVALAPDDGAAWLALAAGWRGQGEILKAADAFAEATRRAPDDVAAHVGLALALTDAGEAEAAKAAADRAVALAPELADAWLAQGTALRLLQQPAAARDAFQRALALAPDRAMAHLNLGLTYIELEKANEARSHLERALQLDPTSAKAHANLSSLYYLAGRKELAKAHAQRALAIEPEMMSAHQNLAALLAEEQDEAAAKDHRDRAYATRNLITTVAVRSLARVLVLTTTESGNTPDRHLIPPRSYTRLLWFIEYASEAQLAGELPDYDVAFNAIGDEDLAGPTAANAARFAAACPTRLLNPPAVISRTRRDRMSELLGGIDGLDLPITVRASADEVQRRGVRGLADAAGLGPAFLVRPIGSHGGKGLFLDVVGMAQEPLTPAAAYYLTAFRDFRSADGFYRKYRTIFVDRQPFPYHLAIAPDWMVHYESSGTADHADRLAEEARFLEDPAAALGAGAYAAVAAVGRAMDLDYAGIDFTLTPDGRVLVFEANATMLVHPEAPEGPLEHKNPYVERIFAAFRKLLVPD